MHHERLRRRRYCRNKREHQKRQNRAPVSARHSFPSLVGDHSASFQGGRFTPVLIGPTICSRRFFLFVPEQGNEIFRTGFRRICSPLTACIMSPRKNDCLHRAVTTQLGLCFVFGYFRSRIEDDDACRFCRNICNHDSTGYSRLTIVIKGVILYDRMPSRALGVTLSVELPRGGEPARYVCVD